MNTINIDGKDHEYTIDKHADLYSYLSDNEINELADSIRSSGLINPITFSKNPDGTITLIDGRNRLKAIESIDKFKLKSKHIIWKEFKNPVETRNYINAVNEKRRHLSLGEIAKLARKQNDLYTSLAIESIFIEGKPHRKKDGTLKAPKQIRTKLANQFGVSESAIGHMTRVWNEGSKNLITAMEEDELKPHLCKNIIRVTSSKEEQDELLEKPIKEIRRTIKDRLEQKKPTPIPLETLRSQPLVKEWTSIDIKYSFINGTGHKSSYTFKVPNIDEFITIAKKNEWIKGLNTEDLPLGKTLI